jgi:hypothetical protein
VNTRITKQTLSETLERASQVVMPTKGMIAKANRKQNYIFTIISVILMILVCALGITLDNWLWSLVTLAVYGIFVTLFIYFRKGRTSLALQVAQLELSVFLRAENNRYYMRNGVELRPSFLARWI